MQPDEFLLLLFFIENILLVGGVLGWTASKALRKQKERREKKTELDANASNRQLASLTEELAEVREMMADLLIEMHQERRSAKPERLPRDPNDGA